MTNETNTIKPLLDVFENMSENGKLQLVRNACYNSHNDGNYCKNELALINSEDPQDEIADEKLVQQQQRYIKLEESIADYEKVHKVACNLYKSLTGYSWTPPSGKTKVSQQQVDEAKAWLAKRRKAVNS